MGPRWTILAPCLAALASLAACTGSATAPVLPLSLSPSTSSAPSPVLVGGVDWSGRLRSCAVALGGPGLGTLVADVVRGDLTGDGRPEWLVVSECSSKTSRWPQQVEVFDGASSPAAPRRLGTLLVDDAAAPRDVTVTVDGVGQVILVGRGLSEDAPSCCPDLRVRRVYAWSGDRFALVDSADTPA